MNPPMRFPRTWLGLLLLSGCTNKTAVNVADAKPSTAAEPGQYPSQRHLTAFKQLHLRGRK